MNVIGPGIISGVLEVSLLADIRSLVSDPDASTSITVSTPTASTPDYASGTQSDTVTSDTIAAHLAPLTGREIGESEGIYELDDRRALISAALLSTSPTTATTITVGASTWRVITAELDGLAAVWRLVIRRAR